MVRKVPVTPAADPEVSGSPHSPHPMAAESNDRSLGPEVRLGNLRLSAPEGWVRKQPRSGFVLAEFALPSAGGVGGAGVGDAGVGTDGRLTVSIAGGSVEIMNVERWQQQFGQDAELKTPKEVEIAGLKVTLVDFSGTFSDAHAAMIIEGESRDYRMLGAIIPLGERLGFIKCLGPKETIDEHADRFDEFVESIELGGADGSP